MSKAKTRLSQFDFSGDNAAVALVHREQGGGANGYKTLIMKSADVSVEMSMAEFLVRFFNIWDGDAAFISKLLGYSEDLEGLWNGEQLESQVTLLNQVKEDADSTTQGFEERFPLTMDDLSEQDNTTLRELTKALASSSNVTLTDVELQKDASGVSDTPTGDNEETPNEVNTDMSTDNVEMIEKSAVEGLVQEAVQKALDAKDAELTDAKEVIKSFEQKEAEAKKAEFVEKAKGFEVLGVEEAQAEDFGVALMKMAETEGMELIASTLEKAVTLVKATEQFEEEGHDIDAEGGDNSVMAIIKAKKAEASK